LSGQPPFFSCNIHALLNDIRQVRYECPEWVSADAKDLIDKLLQHDPDARLVLEEVEVHPWLSNGIVTAPTLATFEYVMQFPMEVSEVAEIINRADNVCVCEPAKSMLCQDLLCDSWRWRWR
jgi:serine/threonine protein kinase